MRYTRGNGVTGNESLDLTNTPLSELLLNNSSEERHSHSGVQLMGKIPDITIMQFIYCQTSKLLFFMNQKSTV